MTNSENIPAFVDSILKVTATEDIDVSEDLNKANADNKTIEDLLKIDQNDKKEEK